MYTDKADLIITASHLIMETKTIIKYIFYLGTQKAKKVCRLLKIFIFCL